MGDFYEVVTQPDDDGITAFVLDRRQGPLHRPRDCER